MMSLYDDDRYSWRETYFVLFEPQRRPRLVDLRRELRPLSKSVKIIETFGDVDGFFTKLIVASYQDHSALEIVYQQGADVVAEMDALFQVLEQGCSAKEKERLRAACRQTAKFDVLHFEQTAGTAAFDVVKAPELEFPPKPYSDIVLSDVFAKKRQTETPPRSVKEKSGTKRPRFHFDPDSYENCRTGSVNGNLERQSRVDAAEDVERIDPNTLVLVLEILCRLTSGVAIDPASGCRC